MGLKRNNKQIMSQGGRLRNAIVDPIEASFLTRASNVRGRNHELDNLFTYRTIQFALRRCNKVVNLPLFSFLKKKKDRLYNF
jgi:hypothetical protein